MCPACLTTMALIAAGSGSTGGATALLWRKLRRGCAPQAPAQTPSQTPTTDPQALADEVTP